MLDAQQAAVVKGRLLRGDRQHDIAADYRENAGRIAEIATGKRFADVKPIPSNMLPPPNEGARFVDPKAPIEVQIERLASLINNPPVNSRVVTFTPQLAEYVLQERNKSNRRLRTKNIRIFASDITNGRWLMTGDTIKFGKGGMLLDGQNRLSASVRSGLPIRTHVVFGIDDNVFVKLDSGRIRTGKDTIQCSGVENSTIVAPATRWLMIYDSNPLDRGRSVTNDDLLSYYRTSVDEERMDRCARRAREIGRPFPPGQMAAHLYMFEKKSRSVADTFYADLARRQRGGRKLVEKMTRLREQNMGRMNEVQVNALLILAWNCYRAGQPVTLTALKWNENMDYPTIR